MRIFVKVKPNAREYRTERIDDSHFNVAVKEPPSEGKANLAVIEELSRYLGVPKSRVRIVHGLTAKQKTVEID